MSTIIGSCGWGRCLCRCLGIDDDVESEKKIDDVIVKAVASGIDLKDVEAIIKRVIIEALTPPPSKPSSARGTPIAEPRRLMSYAMDEMHMEALPSLPESPPGTRDQSDEVKIDDIAPQIVANGV